MVYLKTICKNKKIVLQYCMIKIVYPIPSFKIKKEDNKEFIFDGIRKKWVVLTPEEWVRQNIVQYLIEEKKYPKSLFAIEKEIMLGELKRRCDIVIYKNTLPWMIVECKEMNVTVNEKTFEQILNYNQTLNVEYLVTTNGNSTFAIHCSTKKWLTELPNY